MDSFYFENVFSFKSGQAKPGVGRKQPIPKSKGLYTEPSPMTNENLEKVSVLNQTY